MNNKTKKSKIQLDKIAFMLILILSISLIITFCFLINHINSNPNLQKIKIPIISAILPTTSLILINLPEPMYYLIIKIFKKIDLDIYKDEYTANIMFLKFTGVFMSILCTILYCIIIL